jgi:hypothetical protein
LGFRTEAVATVIDLLASSFLRILIMYDLESIGISIWSLDGAGSIVSCMDATQPNFDSNWDQIDSTEMMHVQMQKPQKERLPQLELARMVKVEEQELELARVKKLEEQKHSQRTHKLTKKRMRGSPNKMTLVPKTKQKQAVSLQKFNK